MKRFLLAVSLLTSIPVRLKDSPEAGDTGRSAAWYPLVGALIGGLTALVYYAASHIFSSSLAAVLSVVAWIGLSGGLHLDGLADCCDGMLNASSRERRLEIMKDPRLGTFGGIGLCLAIILKITCLSCLPFSLAWKALVLSAASARWFLLPAGKQPMARPGGMGVDFALGLNRSVYLPASLVVLTLIAWSGWRGLAAFVLSAFSAWLVIHFAKSRLGGLTGDVFGLLVEITEIVILLVFCVKI